MSPRRVGPDLGPRSGEQGFDSTQRYCSTEVEPEPVLVDKATWPTVYRRTVKSRQDLGQVSGGRTRVGANQVPGGQLEAVWIMTPVTVK